MNYRVWGSLYQNWYQYRYCALPHTSIGNLRVWVPTHHVSNHNLILNSCGDTHHSSWTKRTSSFAPQMRSRTTKRRTTLVYGFLRTCLLWYNHGSQQWCSDLTPALPPKFIGCPRAGLHVPITLAIYNWERCVFHYVFIETSSFLATRSDKCFGFSFHAEQTCAKGRH